MASERMFPVFDNVRLATLGDLPRIATVAASGFYYSPTFRFQRPLFADYVEDTLSSYWTEYQEEIMDPASIVLVAEDFWIESEHEHAYKSLSASPMYCHGSSSQSKVIVGVCGIDLKPGSWRIGQLQPETNQGLPKPHAALNALKRDMSAEALELYSAATAPAKAKFLAGHMRLSTLAVHPAYWRRGHATCLVDWCTALADMDGLQVGVSAAPMGARVAAKAGFEERETVRIKKQDVQRVLPSLTTVGDVELWIAVRQPSCSPSDTGTACSDSPAADSQ